MFFIYDRGPWQLRVVTLTFIYYPSKHSGNYICQMISHSAILRSAHSAYIRFVCVRSNSDYFSVRSKRLLLTYDAGNYCKVSVLHSGVSENSNPLRRHSVCHWVAVNHPKTPDDSKLRQGWFFLGRETSF
jgi:hypothetical protein